MKSHARLRVRQNEDAVERMRHSKRTMELVESHRAAAGCSISVDI
jgi:hypothetical protein